MPFLPRILAVLAIATGFAMAEDAYVEGEVLVTFKPTVDNTGADAALARRSLAVAQRFDRISRQRGKVSTLVREKNRGTAKLIAELKADPTVETVEPNYIRHVSAAASGDPDFTKLWGLHNTGQTVNGVVATAGADTRFSEAWALARQNGPEVVVAVADTGLDLTHPDLSGNLWTNPGEIAGNGIDDDGNGRIDDVHGFDFTANTGSMSDSGEHGTHVAGTIAATGGNGLGITGLQFHAKLLPLKVSSNGESITSSAVLSAFDYAVSMKARGVNIVAINASFGGSSSSSTELAAIQALRDAGIVLCAAAGNSAANNDTTASYPANYAVSNIISVAALTPTNQLASYSNYGATTVDLAAPGSEIYSTLPLPYVSQTALKIGSTNYSASYIEYSGTTGSSGLTKSIYNCGIGQTGQFPSAVSGNIALIQRGTLTFAQKVTNAMAAGAVAAIIYDNTSTSTGGWTLGEGSNLIPAIRISQADGQSIAALALPVSATFTRFVDFANAYQYLDGTSMATPHVTGAVAFAAMNFPSETMAQRISRIVNHTTAVSSLSGKVLSGGRLDLLKMIDTDNDSLPDWWETEQLGTLAYTATADPDGDGITNADEFLAGTAPLNGASKFAFTSFNSNASGVSISFPTVAGRTYQMEWSNNPSSGPWNAFGSVITGDGSSHVFADAVSAPSTPRRFYRLQVVSAAP
ncbi:S8 family serine peptidase [Luteolibacter soli]|uniref:S8 family serine peptidase n=1 Tax=Luteolibacter soli TaxID=3135280 RepID=A0ABU9AZU6_9BACT